MYKDLGDYLKQRCSDKRISMRELSLRLGFSVNYIEGLVNRRFGPSPERCRKIAEFFGDDPNLVLELAGFYIPSQEGGEDRLVREIAFIAHSLSREGRELYLRIGRVIRRWEQRED